MHRKSAEAKSTAWPLAVMVPSQTGLHSIVGWRGRDSTASADNDVTLSALYDGKEFVLLGVGNAKLGHGVIEILAESGPLRFCDFELLVGLAHSTSAIMLGSTRRPADHLR